MYWITIDIYTGYMYWITIDMYWIYVLDNTRYICWVRLKYRYRIFHTVINKQINTCIINNDDYVKYKL